MFQAADAPPSVAIVGGGPAGLMAAEWLAQAGVQVDLFDAMPTAGRKFLLAGKGGLNLTHGEAFDAFVRRYGERLADVEPLLREFGPQELRDWAKGLGVNTFIGSSGRVFPQDLKAAPLLRAWLHRLRTNGVRFHMRQRCLGVQQRGSAQLVLQFDPALEREAQFDAVVLALGGASWPQLGSDGAWTEWLAQLGASVAPLQASNCGFDVASTAAGGAERSGWSEYFGSRFAGQPLKNVALTCQGAHGRHFQQRGEFVVTERGIEGHLVYAASAVLRDIIAAQGQAVAHIDLLADRNHPQVLAEVSRPRGSRSLSTYLKTRLNIDGVKAGLLRELLTHETLADPELLAAAIKALPLPLRAPGPVAEAISTAGGVRFESLDAGLMLRATPGVFCAGEMLDWEAPTGGYLLTACLATGVAAGKGVLAYLAAASPGKS